MNIPPEILAIGERLRTQDNRITQDPMFCIQIKVRDTGYDTGYSDNKCWFHWDSGEYSYEEPENLEGWDEFGYIDRWETVAVFLTEGGCHEHMNINGHNVKSNAHNEEWRIYAESFYRHPEMIAIRKFLMELK